MTRKPIDEVKGRRLAGVATSERAEFDSAYSAAQLAIEVGEQVRVARGHAGLTQRELATRMEARAKQ